MSADVDQALLRAPIFSRLGIDDRRRLAEVARLQFYHRGDMVFAEGDPPGYFCTVVQGRVKVFKMTPAGKDVILEIFGPGTRWARWQPTTGIRFRPRPWPSRTRRCCSCRGAPSSRCSNSIRRSSAACCRASLTGWPNSPSALAELTGGRVEPRFARLFLKLAQEQGRPERGGIFMPVSLSRQELADMTGTTIETSIRIMSRWGKQRIVLTEKDGFLVLNPAELETLALGLTGRVGSDPGLTPARFRRRVPDRHGGGGRAIMPEGRRAGASAVWPPSSGVRRDSRRALRLAARPGPGSRTAEVDVKKVVAKPSPAASRKPAPAGSRARASVPAKARPARVARHHAGSRGGGQAGDRPRGQAERQPPPPGREARRPRCRARSRRPRCRARSRRPLRRTRSRRPPRC